MAREEKRKFCMVTMAQILQDCEAYGAARRIDELTRQRDELLTAMRGFVNTWESLRPWQPLETAQDQLKTQYENIKAAIDKLEQQKCPT